MDDVDIRLAALRMAMDVRPHGATAQWMLQDAARFEAYLRGGAISDAEAEAEKVHRHHTAAEWAEVAAMRAGGATLTECAKKIGMTAAGVRRGLSRAASGRKAETPDERRARLARFAAMGRAAKAARRDDQAVAAE